MVAFTAVFQVNRHCPVPFPLSIHLFRNRIFKADFSTAHMTFLHPINSV